MMRKKILHIQLLPLLSGVQNVMLHILQALSKDEFDIYVACRPDGPLVDEIKRLGYTYLPLPEFVQPLSVKDVIIFVRLYLLCRKHKFDIVHTHSSKPGFIGRITARLAGVPLVLHTGHGAPFHDWQSALTRRFYIELERIAARFCDTMVFVNNYHREFYLKHKLIKTQQGITIYNTLTPEQRSAIEKSAIHRQLSKESIIIGSILRFAKSKNVVMTVEGAIRICRERKDVIFIIVGDGEYYHLCQTMVKSSGMQDRILLPGWQSDTALWLAKFDVFMQYTLYEGLPISIIEAMAASLPIISSDIVTNAELVDSSCGWLIPVANLEKLVSGLNAVLDDKELYRQKGQLAKERVMSLCSYESFVEGYMQIYQGQRL
jgi:glycosyltransferase involved in cell wall biosynthesis